MGPPVESSFSPDEDGEEVPRSLRERIMTWFASLPVSDRERIGMREDSQLVRIGFHQSNRIASDGTLRFGLVVQLVEMQLVPVLGLQRLVPSGATLVIDVNGAMRFVICTAPIAERARDLGKMARIGTTDALGWKLTPEPSNPFAVDYRAMHEGRTA
jgi:hypothetical protein